MATVTIIEAPSGTGKSKSLEGLAKKLNDRTLVCNVMQKPFPFRERFQYVLSGGDVQTILQTCGQAVASGIKVIVIDDATYIMTQIFMSRHSEMRGNQTFQLYNDIADSMWNLILSLQALPDDVTVYLMMHTDVCDDGRIKLRTIGRLLDEKVNIEGMVSILLRGEVKDGRHIFRTRTTGMDSVKTPPEMFADEEIPNDLLAVDVAIRRYYGITLPGLESKTTATTETTI